MKKCNDSEKVKAIYLQGKIDTANSKQIRQNIIDCIDSNTATLLFDLREVTFIDSSGLGSLVFLLKQMRARGGNVIIYRPNDQVKMLLDIANMTQLFPIYNTEEELAQADVQLSRL
jgi:anti-sigma B factor antagonist